MIMSSESIKVQMNGFYSNSLSRPYASSDTSFLHKIKDTSQVKKNWRHFSTKIIPESPLFTMTKLLIENRDQLNITQSVLSINSEDLDLVQKLNHCNEFLAHIPFSFQYDKVQTKILLDFFTPGGKYEAKH